MIQIKTLRFENILSYGEMTEIVFDKGVTQLVGKNGAGKSSIPTILEEALFNKNSKGVKKSELINKFNGATSYFIEVELAIGDDQYKVTKNVASTAKVKLLCNGEDISGHTATQTYAKLSELMGMDFPTFTKLVYQSIKSSLDFISATDANRKKFLVSLLGLESYSEKEIVIKSSLKTAKSLVTRLEGSVASLEKQLSGSKRLEKVEVPEVKEIIYSHLEEDKAQKISDRNSIVSRNKAIERNVKARNALAALTLVDDPKLEEIDVVPLRISAQKLDREIAVASSDLRKLENTNDKCPTCGAPVDIGDTKERIEVLFNKLVELKGLYATASDEYDRANRNNAEIKVYKDFLVRKADLEAAYDSDIPTELESESGLSREIQEIDTVIQSTKATNKANQLEAAKAKEFNSKVDATNEQIDKISQSLKEDRFAMSLAKSEVSKLDVLATALGSKGLVAYKIESVVKVFEGLINKYLQELSDGDFTLQFIMDDTKLQIQIDSGGKLMDISSVSSGEFNKINTATLLAVRGMMTSISKVDVDLLFLDEVVSVLDEESKDNLIQLLLKEHRLNTVIVSHGYTHPLASVIQVIKENRVSRIEHG